MNPAEMTEMASLQAQLNDLYEEREYLEGELGLADARGLVAMVRSLEAQLADLYQEKEEGK